MKDLTDAAHGIMQEMVDDGTVKKMLREKLEKTFRESIDGIFSSYSDFGKGLKKRINEELVINLDQVNFAEYNRTMLQLIEGAVNQNVAESARQKMLEDINSIFAAPPKLISLQDLISAYIEDNQDEAREESLDYAGLVIEKSDHGFIYLGLNKSNRKSGRYSDGPLKQSDCQIRIHFYNWQKGGGSNKLPENQYSIGWVSYNDATVKNFLPTMHYGTARRLFQMYCAGTIVKIPSLDVDDYDHSYPDPY